MEGDPRRSQLLLGLPGPAQRAVVGSLLVNERRSLRLVCTTTTALVDSWATRLRLRYLQLQEAGVELQRRYPSVNQLSVDQDTDWSDNDSGDGEQLAAVHAAPWPAINSLLLWGGRMHTAANTLASLPNVTHLRVEEIDIWGEQPPLEELLCQQLPQLASLALEVCQPLEDGNLVALASLTALTALEGAELDQDVGEDGWAALRSMLQLRSLNITHNGTEERTTMDLRVMTGLTQLSWRISDFMLQHTGWVEQPVALQLPTSLVSLTLEQLPDIGHLPSLPHLTSLQLVQQSLERPQLAWLAANCSSLARLELPANKRQLVLSQACHAAPLLALTELVLGSGAMRQPPLQLVGVFPQLATLVLQCPTSPGMAAMVLRGLALPIKGLTALTCLDVGNRDPSVELRNEDFVALAKLPVLSSMRLCVASVHIRGVQLLAQLRCVEWLWGSDLYHRSHNELQALQEALPAARRPNTLPLQL